jgi:hypothetical protein
MEKPLDAAMLPSWATIVHFRGHQRDGQYLSQGNNTADRIAKHFTFPKPIPNKGLPTNSIHPRRATSSSLQSGPKTSRLVVHR